MSDTVDCAYSYGRELGVTLEAFSYKGHMWKGIWQLGRPSLWVASMVPLVVGSAAAWLVGRSFSLYWFLVALLGLVLIEIGKHGVNELVDFYTGVDGDIPPEKQTPFTGGRRTITQKVLRPGQVVAISFVTLAAACVLGLYVAFARNLLILPIGAAGYIIAILYTLPPAKFAYRGLGELAVGLTYGPLITLGAFVLQAPAGADVSLAFVLSLPIALLIVNVLWINQFPDYEADKRGDKCNWVVRIGKEKSLPVFATLFFGAYVLIALVAVLRRHYALLFGLASLPIAVKSVLTAVRNKDDIPHLIPANAGTILVYIVTGMGLAAALFLGGGGL
ncbi:MAG TPA: prenyltransferase [Rectinemataceae bacterium]|nr:prenyltransferase [Rectinemataceae bacterium]